MISRFLPSILFLALAVACDSAAPPVASDAPESVAEIPAPVALAEAVRNPWRLHPERDAARRPVETLEFFGIGADDTVVELWPGRGWYTAILGPWLKAGGGRLIAAGFDPEGGSYVAKITQAYRETFVDRPEIFGAVEITVLSASSPALAAPGTADAVLTFRNVHNWLAGNYADKVLDDAFAVLKPGGVFGLVEHRLPSSRQQLPGAPSGYVHEELVIGLAQQAGFVLEARSEINANPDDSADHPFGVWTLPPTLRSAPRGSPPDPGFDSSVYQRIGESDRMVLRFRKPAAPPRPEAEAR